MKDACYQSDIINVPTPKCLKGSPWVEERALKNLVGDFADPDVTLVNNDNFHRASTVYPYHHPEIQTECKDSTGPCDVTHISCSENTYDLLNELDLGKTPIAAKEMKVKMKSSQSVHIAGRDADADFDALDMQWDECAKINQEVLDWALEQSSQTAKDNYEKYGQKLVMGKDKEALNGGSWIIQYLEYNEMKDDDMKVELVSISLPLPDTELVPIFKSMHYCKMLTPFRALEWIYVDSQYKANGYQPQEGVADYASIGFLTA